MNYCQNRSFGVLSGFIQHLKLPKTCLKCGKRYIIIGWLHSFMDILWYGEITGKEARACKGRHQWFGHMTISPWTSAIILNNNIHSSLSSGLETWSNISNTTAGMNCCYVAPVTLTGCECSITVGALQSVPGVPSHVVHIVCFDRETLVTLLAVVLILALMLVHVVCVATTRAELFLTDITLEVDSSGRIRAHVE